MPKQISPSKTQISAKLAAKVRAAGLRTALARGDADAKAVRDGAASMLEKLRDEAASAGQFNAAVQAERIRAQIAGTEGAGAGVADLSRLDDDTLRARLDAALSEMKRLAPKTAAQTKTDNAELPDIFA